jgi:glycosyltransferase involved in cell wall biosynthesis
MKISVIIPAYNEEKLIGETLRSVTSALDGFVERGWETELIVCDNNSTDGTAKLARAAGARVVFEGINQIARARNKGAEAAGGDWLLFIDADSRPTRELFQDVAAAIETGKVLAGGSTIRLDAAEWSARAVTAVWNCISRTTVSLAGSFIFCETAAFHRTGGFSLKLFASEELELCKRLKKSAAGSGRKIVILTKHPLMTSARKFHLYTRWEYFRFLRRTVFGWGRTLESAQECHLWYDGRR